jgi:hypothetical protein
MGEAAANVIYTTLLRLPNWKFCCVQATPVTIICSQIGSSQAMPRFPQLTHTPQFSQFSP